MIEVDCGQHAENSRDRLRNLWLADRRYRVLHFWNNEVLENIEGVWDTIFAAASAAPPPHPTHSRVRGEGGAQAGRGVKLHPRVDLAWFILNDED